MDTLMKLAEIPIGSYAAWSVVILVAVSGLIQIAPIKLNPWSTMARRFGRAINHDMLSKFESLEKDVEELRKIGDAREAKEDERNAKAYRMRILRFGDRFAMGSYIAPSTTTMCFRTSRITRHTVYPIRALRTRRHSRQSS